MKTSHLTKAFGVIAEFCTLIEQETDRNGVLQDVNVLSHLQGQVFNTLCWKLDELHANNYREMIQNRNKVMVTNTNSIPYIEKNLQQHIEANKGDETSLNNIAYWRHRLDKQVERTAHAKALLDVVCAVYEANTGAKYAVTDVERLGKAPPSKATMTEEQRRQHESIVESAMAALNASRQARGVA